jgi:hypothetical protein
MSCGEDDWAGVGFGEAEGIFANAGVGVFKGGKEMGGGEGVEAFEGAEGLQAGLGLGG